MDLMALFEGENFKAKIYSHLLREKDQRITMKLAMSKKMDHRILRHLYEQGMHHDLLAENPNTPHDVLRHMIAHGTPGLARMARRTFAEKLEKMNRERNSANL